MIPYGCLIGDTWWMILPHTSSRRGAWRWETGPCCRRFAPSSRLNYLVPDAAVITPLFDWTRRYGW